MSENPRSPGPVDGQHRPGQTGTPGTPGPVPGRPGITPGPESTHQPLEASEPGEPAPDSIPELPRLQQPRRGRRLAKKPEEPASPLTREQRLLVLDAWQRSCLPARDFAPLVGMSRHTLYAWKKKFERPSRANGQAAWRSAGPPPARAHQVYHPDAQESQSRMGCGADHRDASS